VIRTLPRAAAVPQMTKMPQANNNNNQQHKMSTTTINNRTSSALAKVEIIKKILVNFILPQLHQLFFHDTFFMDKNNKL
jgi:hypothetical protein